MWSRIRATIALAWLVLTSCVGSFQNVPGDNNPAHTSACMTLDSKHRTGGTVAAASIAAGVALASMSALEAKDHPNTAMYLSLGGIGTGIIGAGASYYTDSVFSDYQNLCTAKPVVTTTVPVTPTPVPVKP